MAKPKFSDVYEDDYAYFFIEYAKDDRVVHGPFADRAEAEIKQMELDVSNVNTRFRKPNGDEQPK